MSDEEKKAPEPKEGSGAGRGEKKEAEPKKGNGQGGKEDKGRESVPQQPESIFRQRLLPRPFVLTRYDLSCLHDSFKEFSPNVRGGIRCRGGEEKAFEAFEELLDYENPRSKQIKTLQIWTPTDDSSQPFALLLLGAERYLNVSLVIEGPRDSAQKLFEVIESRLSNMRPWYGSFATINFLLLVCVMAFAVTVGGRLGSRRASLRTTGGISTEVSESATTKGLIRQVVEYARAHPWNLVLWIAAEVTAAFVIIVLLLCLHGFLFPMSFFALGLGEKRYKDRDNIRFVFIGSIAIPLAGAILFWIVRAGL